MFLVILKLFKVSLEVEFILKFKVEFNIEFELVELLELELITREFLIWELLIIEGDLIGLFKGEEQDISPIKKDSLSLLNN